MLLVNIIVVVQILAALAMAGLVLMQHGKGADMGAAFGSGSAGSLFGASGGANFLSRMTAVSATIFFASTLALAYFASEGLRKPASSGSVLENPALVAPVPQSSGSGVSSIPGQGGTGGADAINTVPQSSTTAPESQPAAQPAAENTSDNAAEGASEAKPEEAASATDPAAGEASAADAVAGEQEAEKQQ